MTTETTARSATRQASASTARSGSARIQLVTGAATLGLGGVVALFAWPVAGRPAALAALVGTVLIVLVLVGGSLVLDLVATLLPAASLLIALLTYTLQLVVLIVALLALERSGLLGGELDRGWLGGAVITATALWMAAQLRVHLTRRIPAYDLVATPTSGPGEGGQQ